MNSLNYSADKKFVCEKLTDPANGNVKVSGIYPGDKAIYKCDIGYILVGESSRKCLPSGKWSGEAPKCARMSYHNFAIFMIIVLL